VIVDRSDQGNVVRILADGVLFVVVKGTFKEHPADDVAYYLGEVLVGDGDSSVSMCWDSSSVTGYGVG
jgi:hypothetical protein